MHTVTCNGRPMKVSESLEDCKAFVAMQKRKLRGAGLAANPVTDPKIAAAAALDHWVLREHRAGDRRSLLRLDDAPRQKRPI